MTAHVRTEGAAAGSERGERRNAPESSSDVSCVSDVTPDPMIDRVTVLRSMRDAFVAYAREHDALEDGVAVLEEGLEDLQGPPPERTQR